MLRYKKLRIILTTCFLASSILSMQAGDRDGCTEIAEACNCGNVLTGLCFPGLFTDQFHTLGYLNCDCLSDVLNAQEIIDLMIKKYAPETEDPNEPPLKNNSKFKEHYPQAENALKAIIHARQVIKEHPGSHIYEITQNGIIRRARRKLISMLPLSPGDPSKGIPSLISYFVKTADGCFYYGQKCRCSNTGLEGICSIDRSNKTKIYCHCG